MAGPGSFFCLCSWEGEEVMEPGTAVEDLAEVLADLVGASEDLAEA